MDELRARLVEALEVSVANRVFTADEAWELLHGWDDTATLLAVHRREYLDGCREFHQATADEAAESLADFEREIIQHKYVIAAGATITTVPFNRPAGSGAEPASGDESDD